MCIDRRTIPQFLYVTSDYELIGPQTASDDPIIANLRAESDIHDVRSIVGPCDVNLLDTLKLLNRYLRHKDGVPTDLRLRRHTAELAWTQHIVRIRKRGRDADRSSLLVHLTINEYDVTLVRPDRPICQGQCQG